MHFEMLKSGIDKDSNLEKEAEAAMISGLIDESIERTILLID